MRSSHTGEWATHVPPVESDRADTVDGGAERHGSVCKHCREDGEAEGKSAVVRARVTHLVMNSPLSIERVIKAKVSYDAAVENHSLCLNSLNVLGVACQATYRPSTWLRVTRTAF